MQDQEMISLTEWPKWVREMIAKKSCATIQDGEDGKGANGGKGGKAFAMGKNSRAIGGKGGDSV